MQANERAVQCVMNNNNEEFFRIASENKGIINYIDQEGNTILHISALYGNLDVAKFAVQQGVQIESKNKQGKKALTLAMENKKNNVSSYLINVTRTEIVERAKLEQNKRKKRFHRH